MAELQLQAGAARNANALQTLSAMAEDGRIDAQRAVGEILARQRDEASVPKGVAWLQRAAASGDAEATFMLGKLHFRGEPPLTRDYEAAARQFAIAAQKGHGGAAYYLGLMFRNGYGVRAAPTQAARWFEQAADTIPAARFMLANAYRYGEGVEKDEARALALYQSAAEDESPEAVQTLAMAYRNGELGLARDPMQFGHYVLETAHSLKHPARTP